jgi:hypothetical protein
MNKSQLGKVSAFIERTHTIPFAILIQFAALSLEPLEALKDILSPHWDRVSAFLIHSEPMCPPCGAMFFPLPGKLPLLQILDIDIVDAHPEPIPLLTADNEAPLSKLGIQGPGGFTLENIHAQSLTRLVIGDQEHIGLGDTKKLLAETLPLMLMEFSTFHRYQLASSQPPESRIKLPVLLELKLDDSFPLSFPIHFDTPDIMRLRIEIIYPPIVRFSRGNNLPNAPRPPTIQNFPNLLELGLSVSLADPDDSVDIEAMEDFLRVETSVIRLDLDSPSLWDKVVPRTLLLLSHNVDEDDRDQAVGASPSAPARPLEKEPVLPNLNNLVIFLTQPLSEENETIIMYSLLRGVLNARPGLHIVYKEGDGRGGTAVPQESIRSLEQEFEDRFLALIAD